MKSNTRRFANLIRLILATDDKKDQSDGLQVLKKFAGYVLPRYRFTFPQIEWWNDADFNSYLEKFGERQGFNTHRRWLLGQLLRMTASIEGDTVECGVYKGAGSWLMLQANAKTRRRVHHIFDSFEGLSAPDPVDGQHWTRGDLAAGTSVVEQNLLPYKHGIDFKMYKGWIPERFNEVSDLKFSFIHIDVDLYQPTFESIRFFYPRMSMGSILLCDDYGFSTCPGATEAINSFLAEMPEKMISLPDGGGFFIKGIETR